MHRLSGEEQGTDGEIKGGKQMRISLVISSKPCDAKQKFGEKGRGMSVDPDC